LKETGEGFQGVSKTGGEVTPKKCATDLRWAKNKNEKLRG